MTHAGKDNSSRTDANRRCVERLVRRIFKRLDIDIRDRQGLKHEWRAISEEVMNEELRPEWERIMRSEITRFLENRKTLSSENLSPERRPQVPDTRTKSAEPENPI